MTKNAPVRLLSHLRPLLLSLCLIAAGCGGSGYSPSPQPTPSPTPTVVGMQGSWTIYFQSSVSPNSFTVLEANLSQAGTKVFAGAPSALVYQGTTLGTTIPLTSLGSRCDSGAVGQVTFDGTLTNVQPTTETVTFSLTQNGALGTAVIIGSASTNGAQITNGTYTIPAACGAPEDHGTFEGFQDSVKFSGLNAYHGTFQGNAITVQFASDNAFGISATGTYSGTPFTLTGSATGFFLTLAGQISGQAVTWFGLYDSTYNEIRVYDSEGKPLGLLGGNTWDY
jgi:hypothetical protein